MMFWYVSPLKPITAERAMQCVIAALYGAQSDKDKLMKIQTYCNAWVYERPEPTP